MKKFSLGMVAGASSLALAVPLIAQISSAQSSSSPDGEPPTPTQACAAAMVALDDAHLALFDSMTADRKKKLQEKRDVLAAIAAISDDAQRADAFKKMHDDMRAAKDGSPMTPPDTIVKAMEAVRGACGETFGPGMHYRKMKMGGFGMMMGRHKGPGMMGGGW